MEISGHAGYAESGKDIVCASITAFTQTLNKYSGSVVKTQI
nr:ribosomal-processing cysteine protease Prp [uncultured Blautia sp.]